VEVLAHRVLWSALTALALVAVLRRHRAVLAAVRARRTLLLLVVAAATISVNWGTYIYGVTSGRVVETSLGYFINPLVTVLMGVLVLGERLRRLQWWALAVAGLAVVVLSVAYGRPPWVAIALALTFGTYGLAKKSAGVGPIESLAVETVLLVPVAAVYLGWLVAAGASTFGTAGAGHALLLTTTGVVTVVPLLCFGAAALRVPLTTLGLLQYVAPVVQFALGVVVFREEMPAARWVGFALVWVALVVFTVESVTHRRRQLRLVAEASAL
jgi:chloramphenicol-sensitive protein RarD